MKYSWLTKKLLFPSTILLIERMEMCPEEFSYTHHRFSYWKPLMDEIRAAGGMNKRYLDRAVKSLSEALRQQKIAQALLQEETKQTVSTNKIAGNSLSDLFKQQFEYSKYLK